MHRLKTKLPTRKEIFTVFSVAMFLSFTWSIYRMFFQVPSWLFYFNLLDILTLSAYVVAFSLLESAFLLGSVTLLALIYPSRFFSRKFIAQSSIILLVLTIGAVLYQQNIGMLKKWGLVELLEFLFAFLAGITFIILAFSYLFNRFNRFKGWVEAFADRLTVFAIIYLPVSVLGFAVVLVRNIFIR